MGSVFFEMDSATMRRSASQATKYPNISRNSTVLIVGHQPPLNRALLNSLTRLHESSWHGVRKRGSETYSKFGLSVHELVLSFEGSSTEPNGADRRLESDGTTTQIPVVALNVMNTPEFSSAQVNDAFYT